MNTTNTTSPPGLPGGKRPGWARRHPFWSAFLGGLAALAVMATAFFAWLSSGAPSTVPASSAAPAVGPAAPAPAAPFKITPVFCGEVQHGPDEPVRGLQRADLQVHQHQYPA